MKAHPVVQVYVVCRPPTGYIEPWRPEPIKKISGTASLIIYEGKKYIITNEHVIRGQTQVHLTISGYARLFPVEVVHENYTCDLAILKLISDQNIFDSSVEYVQLDTNIPANGTKVITHGFPIGGRGYCQTEGVVSRTESNSYLPRGLSLILIQISAPINPGSSGGIATTSGNKGYKVLGITSSGLMGAQNVGYIIPGLIIEKFLRQYLRFSDNSYRPSVSFPTVSFHFQPLKQTTLRAMYGLIDLDKQTPDTCGVLIIEIPDHSCAKNKLYIGDVILALDQYSVRSDGKINYHGAEISLDAYLALKQLGDEVVMTVWRKTDFSASSQRQKITLSLRLTEEPGDCSLFSCKPLKPLIYYVHPDGAIFIVPDHPYLQAYDKRVEGGGRIFNDTTARPKRLESKMYDDKTSKQRQIVFLHHVLSTTNSLGETANQGEVPLCQRQ